MNVKAHYEQHLAHFYEWMLGDFDSSQQQQEAFFRNNDILPKQNKRAIDLGAGHGLQSVSLAKIGFDVTAIDFNQQLLDQLAHKKGLLKIKTIKAEMQDFDKEAEASELIVCMGDTIAHLDSFDQLQDLISKCYHNLVADGTLVFSYRDYSQPLTGDQRFIPVRADEHRILTCILDYLDEKVTVTDQLYEKTAGEWVLKVSSYEKLRIQPQMVEDYLTAAGFNIVKTESINRLHYTIARK